MNTKRLIFIIAFMLLPSCGWGEYSIPASRVITWSAGLDPIGGIPTTYTTCVTTQCDIVYGGDVTVTTINNAITSAPSNTVIRVPAGPYTIAGDILMKSSVVLRGAKDPTAGSAIWLPTADSAATTLSMGTYQVYFNGGSQASTWSPGAGLGTAITSGYTKDSTSVTLSSSSGYSVGDWISVFQNSDATLPIDYRSKNYLGEDNCSGYDCHVKQQFSKITAINGNVLTISPEIYMVSDSPTGQAVRKLTFGMTMAGIENIRLQGDGTQDKGVFFRNTLYCWMDGIEAYDYGGGGSSGHIETWFSHGNEYRNSYIHTGLHSTSHGYGISFYYWNSGHKVENNIVRDVRHAIVLEGGTSGSALLYNYAADNYEGEDNTYLSESMTQNHGAHPHMNLWEGNIDDQFYADWTQGSSSHNTEFRNYVRGYRDTPAFASSTAVGIKVGPYSRYYNLVGNIIGVSSWTTGTVVCAESRSTCGVLPHAFEFGIHTDNSFLDSGAYNTALLHGNYDYITDGVSLWQGGSDHNLPSSLYYRATPAWWDEQSQPGKCRQFPVIGPDVGVADNPAKDRYEGQVYSGSDCGTLSSRSLLRRIFK